MGLFFGPGNESFKAKTGSDYIDKTMMISVVNDTLFSKGKLSCVSRPRRFGKTYAAAMLAAYYDMSCDSHEIFDGLKISEDPGYEKHINKYNVMYLDMSFFLSKAEDRQKVVPYTIMRLNRELEAMYPEWILQDTPIEEALNIIVEKSGTQFMAIIDEWDAPLRDSEATERSKKDYLEFLRSLFKNDMRELYNRDDVITLLIHFGYLAYDKEDGSCHIPNHEIKLEFDNSIRHVTHKETAKRVQLSDRLFDAVEDLDEEAVAAIIQEVHNAECSPRHYNTEDSLRQVIKLAFFTYRDYYTQLEEVGGGTGFADIVFVPRKAARRSLLIIELKKDSSPEEAIDQIKERGYMTPYLTRDEDILLIGVSYDSSDPEKKHFCRIEEVER